MMGLVKRTLCVILAAACVLLTACVSEPAAAEPPEYVPVIVIPDFGRVALRSENGVYWPLTDIPAQADKEYVDRIYSEFALSSACEVKVKFEKGSAEYVGGEYGVLADRLRDAVGESCASIFYYDWRLDCRREAESFRRFITQTLKETGARRVNVVAHGMGGLILAQYLNAHSKDGFVGLAVTVGTPFTGMPGIPSKLFEKEKKTVLGRLGTVDTADRVDIEKKIRETYLTFPSVFELAYYERYGELGMLFSNGDLRDNATQAESSAYSFHFAVTENLATIFSRVRHVNIVGVGTPTEDADYYKSDGDGTVTASSAQARGVFDGNEGYEKIEVNASHTDLVTDENAVREILRRVVEKHGKG